MTYKYIQGILSLIAGIALIVLIIGIFSNVIPFNIALFIAISLWILAGVGESYLGIQRSGKFASYSGWRTGIVALTSAVGVIILLAGVFLQSSYFTFDDALILAITFWVGSSILASFLGVNKTGFIGLRHHGLRRRAYQPINQGFVGYSTTYSSNPPYSQVSASSTHASYPQNTPNNPVTAKPYTNNNYQPNKPVKIFCPKCGASMHFDDTFCSNCGSSIEN